MNRRPLVWLFPLGVIASVLSFPLPMAIGQVLLAIVVVALLIISGLYFGSKHGLGSAIPSLRQVLSSLLIGFASGALVVAMLPILGLQDRMRMDGVLPLWQRFVMSFTAGVLEEIIFRLFVVSLMVWLLARVMPRNAAIWTAIIIAALLFGAAHLERWMDRGPAAIAAVMFVNGIAALILGIVYVKWGIESAMITHFAADVAVHVCGPYLFT
jgi:membrane protease YdiL (CAAX protease family)